MAQIDLSSLGPTNYTPSVFGGGRGSYLTGQTSTTPSVPQTPTLTGAPSSPSSAFSSQPAFGSPAWLQSQFTQAQNNATQQAASQAQAASAPATAFAFQNNAGYNPGQYATPQTAQTLAGMFGGTANQVFSSGPNGAPPYWQNVIPGMKDPSNSGLLAQDVNDYGAPMTQALLNAQNNYNGLGQIQKSIDYSNNYFAGMPTANPANIVQATLRYSGGTPVSGIGGTLYRDPTTGKYYNAYTNADRGGAYIYDVNHPLDASMFTPNSGSSYYTFDAGTPAATAPGSGSSAPQVSTSPGSGSTSLGYTPNTNVGGGVIPQNDTTNMLLPAIMRYFNGALGGALGSNANVSGGTNPLVSLLSSLFGVPLDNFFYNGQPRYSLFY